MDRDIPCSWIGGFNVTQVSVIITQVKNRLPCSKLSQEIEIS